MLKFGPCMMKNGLAIIKTKNLFFCSKLDTRSKLSSSTVHQCWYCIKQIYLCHTEYKQVPVAGGLCVLSMLVLHKTIYLSYTEYKQVPVAGELCVLSMLVLNKTNLFVIHRI